jgi:hypothetical protein
MPNQISSNRDRVAAQPNHAESGGADSYVLVPRAVYEVIEALSRRYGCPVEELVDLAITAYASDGGDVRTIYEALITRAAKKLEKSAEALEAASLALFEVAVEPHVKGGAQKP